MKAAARKNCKVDADTEGAISRLHGILKRKPGEKSFTEEWAEHKREEITLEERKYEFCTRSR